MKQCDLCPQLPNFSTPYPLLLLFSLVTVILFVVFHGTFAIKNMNVSEYVSTAVALSLFSFSSDNHFFAMAQYSTVQHSTVSSGMIIANSRTQWNRIKYITGLSL